MEQTSGTTNTILSVQFIDANTGWASCFVDGEVLRTTDGGVTWSKSEVHSIAQGAYDVHFANANVGHAITHDSIYRSVDGGVTWSSQEYYEHDDYSALNHRGVFTNSTNSVYVAGTSDRHPFSYDATVFRDDRSFSGDFHEDLVPNDILESDRYTCIHFTNDSTGYTGGMLGTIYKMELEIADINGNYGWTQKHQSSRATKINDIEFVSDDMGAYIQSDGADFISSYISITTDAGESWSTGSVVDTFDVEGLSFVNSTTLYIAGSGGRIFKAGITIEEPPTSLSNLQIKQELTAYPNPAINNFTIVNAQNATTIKLTNTQGIEQSVSTIISDNKIEISNIENLSEGMYYIQVIDSNNEVIGYTKMVKE